MGLRRYELLYRNMSSGSAIGPNDSLDPGYLELDCICQLLIQGTDVHLKVILTPGAI